MAKRTKQSELEVCYVDTNGLHRLVACLELDRVATNGGTSVSDAMNGDVITINVRGKQVRFAPQNLVWVRTLVSE